MLTKADIKFVKALGDKNVRYANKLFVAEGSKSVNDLLASNLKPVRIFAQNDWIVEQTPEKLRSLNIEIVKPKEILELSSLSSTRNVIGLFQLPEFRFEPTQMKGLILALDTLQDPGNLGTIIRLADWYGIEHILCTQQTVDCFNHKVVQSTMGSIGRVKIHYGDLSDMFRSIDFPVVAGSMEGDSARSFDFPSNMILLIGNEGSGISQALRALVKQTIKIEKRGKAESLNAGVAAAILMDRYFGQHTS